MNWTVGSNMKGAVAVEVVTDVSQPIATPSTARSARITVNRKPASVRGDSFGIMQVGGASAHRYVNGLNGCGI